MCQLVTVSIPFQLVSPANILNGAFCGNGYCWCCVLLGNAYVCTVSSYEFLVFLCQFVAESRCRWFHLVPGGFNSFQVLPACSNWFQVVNSFQLNPCFSMYATGLVRHYAPIFGLKSYWMNIKFLNENNFLNETKFFEWTCNFWMKLLKLIKQHKI